MIICKVFFTFIKYFRLIGSDKKEAVHCMSAIGLSVSLNPNTQEL